MIPRPFQILLVEDNPDDVLLIKRALATTPRQYSIAVAGDGVQAAAYVSRRGEYANAPVPDLVLLDLKLPKKDGRQVLAEIRAHKDLHDVPVVVLTSSETEDDSFKSYAGHANSYIKKSIDLEEFTRMLRHIVDFWLSGEHDVTSQPQE